MAGSIHSFLRGDGTDGRGRTLADVLAFDDDRIEHVHDFIQWLFPLPERSQAVPGSPVLGAAEAAAIRADARALDGFRAALARMALFYDRTDAWLTGLDHNHLRITRILRASRDLLGPDEAQAFHRRLLTRHDAAGAPINRRSLGFWQDAVG
ncbi:hypothetical protein [Rhizosaccharibacter radicis]|uniref:Opioid growth factor receptor-related protein n=1 Tax=Rhizosaccharibacter radicis TaxID=2782605 RepID=A0ABT1VT06_9PROT|nr:opioid growth factor receptor-related protein [Acetobacteraceae bacterium KSS12]